MRLRLVIAALGTVVAALVVLLLINLKNKPHHAAPTPAVSEPTAEIAPPARRPHLDQQGNELPPGYIPAEDLGPPPPPPSELPPAPVPVP